MAFGSGVLICALTFGLMEEAFKHGGFDAIIVGFLLGGLVFISGDFLIHRIGGRNHKRNTHFKSTRETNGKAIVLGSLLDGVPESIALGVALLSKNGIGLLMLAAIFLSNLPESLSSIDDLQREVFSKRSIYFAWSIVSLCVAMSVVRRITQDELTENLTAAHNRGSKKTETQWTYVRGIKTEPPAPKMTGRYRAARYRGPR